MSGIIEFLRQNAPLLTIISIGLTIYIYLKNKKKKELSYQEVSSTPLIKKLHNKVRIHVDDQEIKEDLYLVVLKIFNSGNEAIKKDDFESDILIRFTDGYRNSKVFDAEIFSTIPADIQCDLYNQEYGKELGFSPLLLNPGEGLTIKLLVSKYDKISIKSRIVGGTIIRSIKKDKKWFFGKINSNLILILMIVYLIVSMIYSVINQINKG
ncbi:hypothetical protein CN444_16175 [Bacillus thuringiensis]|uniref:hypothetical protein n=1 Tax=Bacillus thuringiensis TaxID=1428 RepID=UPI000BF5155B|nr:hypothetical protein [Bacillus thuringiensis]PEW46630.1 hypothetical protein CN444_16175 [Bacillus thuringiensis]